MWEREIRSIEYKRSARSWCMKKPLGLLSKLHGRDLLRHSPKICYLPCEPMESDLALLCVAKAILVTYKVAHALGVQRCNIARPKMTRSGIASESTHYSIPHCVSESRPLLHGWLWRSANMSTFRRAKLSQQLSHLITPQNNSYC